MAQKLTEITFEKEEGSDTSILIIRDNKHIGRIWSQNIGDESTLSLPYPHDEKSIYCKNAIQICGFDNMSEVWPCGVFSGKKDCVVAFDTIKTEYDKQHIKQYEEYVKSFFESQIREVTSGAGTFNVSHITTKKDIRVLQSYHDWSLHNV